jgi:O-antigen/teichoic acid export membrane protein
MRRHNSYIYRVATEVVKVATSKELLKEHLRTPLYKNAYYLMASSIAVSLSGFAFWIIAARFYSTEEVGLAAAIIAAWGLLANISVLGLNFSLIRFLPSAGDKSNKLINFSFTFSGLAAIAVGAIFLAGLGFWSPALLFLRGHPVYIISFLAFAVVWTLSAIADHAFIALRSAKFTFIKNAIASVLKIPLPIVFAAFFGVIGIYGSMGLAMAAGVAVALLWFLPKVHKGYLPLPALRSEVGEGIFRFSSGNYIANLLWVAPTFLFPLMVVNILGAEPNAYFYIAWAIAAVIFVIPTAFSSSLFAEGSYQEEQLLANVKRSLKLSLLILLPLIAIIFALGDKLLLAFGVAYSQNATTLLWVLAVSAIPLGINNLYLAVMRVRKNIKRLIALSVVTACLCLGLSYPLMLNMGLLGVGVGWIIGQSLVAAAITLSLLRRHLMPSSNRI